MILAGLPTKGFGCILADPPWKFKSYTSTQSQNWKSGRNVERHYRTMDLDAIKALPMRDYAAATGCHLFLWTTGPMIPSALEVVKSWGFKYSGIAFTWIKLRRALDPLQLRVLPSADGDFHCGLGLTTRKNAEFVILARRGGAKRLAKNVRELIIAPVREHSRKPDETYERIERYCCGPRLELFGRQERPGWTVRGDEVGKFK